MFGCIWLRAVWTERKEVRVVQLRGAVAKVRTSGHVGLNRNCSTIQRKTFWREPDQIQGNGGPPDK